MRQTAILAALAFSSTAFAADPQLMNMVMPDAKILAGVNGTNTRVSPFGQYIISKVAALDLKHQKLLAAAGFDPLQDVTEVLAASNANAAQPSSLLLVEGNFAVDKIVAAITAHSKVQVQTVQGATVLSATDAKTNKTTALAFIGNSIAVVGDLASVEAAIARNGGSSSTAIDPALATQVSQLSSTEDEWLVSSASTASLLPANTGTNATGPLAQILPVLQSIQSFSGGINFTDNIVMTGQATASTPQNAMALAAVIKLAVSLASMAGNNAGAGKNADLTQLIQLVQTLQVSPDGSSVNLSLSIPETQVEALLNQVLKQATPAIPADVRARRRANGN